MKTFAPGNSLSSNNDKFLSLFFSLYFIIYIALAFLSPGTYETGDSINHYLISRFSFIHHELFLHHWGKPFFTLVSSPFSQFGFIGIKIFNIICGATAIFFTYKICGILLIENRFLIFAFILFTPVYTRCLLSGLTEPLFSAILISATYLYFKNKFTLGTILFSLLPFVRTEGFLLLPLPFLYLIFQHQFRSIIFLFVGSIAYSIIGYFIFNDFLWVIHQNPYKGAEEIYGHGGRLHFIKHYNSIWGLPIFICLVLGVISEIIFFLKAQNNKLLKSKKLFLYSFFIIYFFAHVIFWWQGLFSSIGTVRVVAAVLPISAIICLEGFNFLRKYLPKKMERYGLSVIIAIMLVWLVGNKIVPIKLSIEEKVIKESSEWIAESKLEKNKMYYFYPWVSILLNRDIFDKKFNEEPWGLNDKNYVENIPTGSLLIWDSHFSSNEAKISKESVLNNKNFILLKQFKSDKLWTDLDKSKKYFEVYIFEKI